jgi:fructuronate reductase
MTKPIQSVTLNETTLSDIQADNLPVPQYRNKAAGSSPKTGIVHIGPGAFFRAHQAWYTHMAMQNSGGDWAITGVSMRSENVADALNPQQGLYCLAELDAATKYEIIGSINEVLVAPKEYNKVIDRLTNNNTHYVTLTITEKGYCLNSHGQLDTNNNDVMADLSRETQHKTAIGMLSHALQKRFTNGQSCLCVISCDNVTDNGKKLRKSLLAYAQRLDANYAVWLEEHLICPCTMVDSITPATDDGLRDQVKDELNLIDNWPIKRESFVQWVIEDTLPKHRPDWASAGAIFTNNVNGFEKAKLQLLNCPHSTMAYIGCLSNIETVFDAMQNQHLVSFIETLIDEEVMPSVQEQAPEELNPVEYSQSILQRFRNPSIKHLLSQIAWDGSQKLPMRILPIVEQNIAEGKPIKHLCTAICAWILFTRKRFIDQETLVDPLADDLFAIAEKCNGQAEHDISLYLSLSKVFTSTLSNHEAFKQTMTRQYEKLLPLLSNQDYEWTA